MFLRRGKDGEEEEGEGEGEGEKREGEAGVMWSGVIGGGSTFLGA